VHDLAEFEELLTNAMITGGLLILVIGLGGSIILGTVASRRVDGVTRAIQRIVEGDLSQRLPDHGGHDDVMRLIRVVNPMLDDIQHLMHEVKGVCDNIAHDLRTPLTRLLAGLERVRRRGASVDEYGAAVDQAVNELSSVLLTFSAMLRISEIEDGARRGGFVPVDLRRIAEDVADYYGPAAEEAGTKLSIRPIASAPVPMQGDPSLLFEAVSNLVENALKFTPPGGQVTVTLSEAGKHPGIRVADTGPGIPAEIREQVLKRFVRGEASRHTPGNGLGLSMVAAVARLHGMALTIDGDAGCIVTLLTGGATPGFRCRLTGAAFGHAVPAGVQ
jgi:signal transduction histidine kinase